MLTAVLIIVVISLIANVGLTLWRIHLARKLERMTAKSLAVIQEHLSRIDTVEELLLSVENYTRKHRHAVAGLVQAIWMVFPETKTKASADLTPIDLEDSHHHI